MADLCGKVAIVTGASSGIGEAIAVLLAQKGSKVTLCGRDEDRLNNVLNKCCDASGGNKDRFITIRGDITHSEHRMEVMKKTLDAFGQLDILIPNAGMAIPIVDTVDATEETYDSIMAINVKSVFFMCQIAIPELEKSKGVIVTISSIFSTWSAKNMPFVYAMSKAAIDHYTRSLALTLGPKGIRINAVNPGYICTRILRHVANGNQENIDQMNDKFVAEDAANHPLNGRCGTAEEVAKVVAFLASEASSFVTGERIRVDGGREMMGHREPGNLGGINDH